MKVLLVVGVLVAGCFSVFGAYVASVNATPAVVAHAQELHRSITQQDEIERLKAELEAAKAANAELAARPPQVVYDAPELAL